MILQGKGILLTGAGSGIGRALAEELSAKGAHLILAGRRAAALEETRASLTNREHVLTVPADITKPAGRKALKDAVTDHFGRLDILINNAGVVGVELLDHTTDKDIQAMVDTNLVAPIALTREMMDLLVNGVEPRVVNVGSMFGDIGFPYFAAYSATKFGMRGFSDALRREIAPMGVGVTYCAPRATDTPAAGNFSHLVKPFAMKLDSTEKVAKLIINGIEAKRRSIYPKGPERFFVLMQRLFPAMVDGSIIKQYEDARHALKK